MSGARRTSLTTAEHSRRGSFSSPASMALISWATRSWRWLVVLISALQAFPVLKFELRPSNQFHGMADQNGAEQAVRFRQYVLQRFLNVLLLAGKRDDSHNRPLPDVLMIELRDGHVEFFPEAILQ